MSVDNSLRTKASLARHRNVLSRAERVARLKDAGLWSAEAEVLGLPKVGNRKLRAGKKVKKAPGEEAAAATPTPEKK